jgi:hypothetical protein
MAYIPFVLSLDDLIPPYLDSFSVLFFAPPYLHTLISLSVSLLRGFNRKYHTPVVVVAISTSLFQEFFQFFETRALRHCGHELKASLDSRAVGSTRLVFQLLAKSDLEREIGDRGVWSRGESRSVGRIVFGQRYLALPGAYRLGSNSSSSFN